MALYSCFLPLNPGTDGSLKVPGTIINPGMGGVAGSTLNLGAFSLHCCPWTWFCIRIQANRLLPDLGAASSLSLHRGQPAAGSPIPQIQHMGPSRPFTSLLCQADLPLFLSYPLLYILTPRKLQVTPTFRVLCQFSVLPPSSFSA